MKKNIIIMVAVLIAIVVCVIGFQYVKIRNDKAEKNMNYEISESVKQDYENTKNNSIMYKENATMNDLKEEYKITGDNSLYNIEIESDGRRVLNIKPSINYKVAFCGMIKEQMPVFEELDEIYAKSAPAQNGIWIHSKDREKIVEYLNNNRNLKAKYEVNQEGYLTISEYNNLSENDKKIKELLEGNKQYILSISSKCYMIDVVTGAIIENRYNELDEYQTYDYFEDANKTILFISENTEKKLTNDEIFESLMNLVK